MIEQLDGQPSIEGCALSFAYRQRTVLSDLNFKIQSGITGLLGPNGAGKTTLLRLLATLAKPDSGSVIISGKPVSAQSLALVRRQIGYLPQRFDVLGVASVRRNVAYAAWSHGVDPTDCQEAADEALALVSLSERGSERAKSLSGGMRQRLGIACAIVHKPKVLLLDEPTVGLDPMQRVSLRTLLEQISENTCVLTSTHLIDDLTATATDTIILNDRHIRFHGPTTQLSEIGRVFPQHGMSEYEAAYVAILGGTYAETCQDAYV